MLIGFDGTGDADDGVYRQEMKFSFINQLKRDYSGHAKMYFRGPSTLGVECSQIAERGMIAARVAIKAKEPVFLAGYSRGGAIAIRIAQLIEKEFPEVEIPVMALFDAVDREVQHLKTLVAVGSVSWAIGGPVIASAAVRISARSWVSEWDVSAIPENVGICYHAMRSPLAHSRVWFGNCGLNPVDPERLVRPMFITTHGGMGGVPFPTGLGAIDELALVKLTPKQELQGSWAVQDWMWSKLRLHGLVCSAVRLHVPRSGATKST